MGLACAVPYGFTLLLVQNGWIPLPGGAEMQGRALLLWTMGMTFLGWLDDRFDSGRAKGFCGHWNRLVREGEFTMGMVKAAGGLVLAPGVAHGLDGQWGQTLVDGLVMALMSNAVNLLDVRSGRAVKGALLLAVPLLFLTPSQACLISLLLLFAVVLAYAPVDLQETAMLGDCGAYFIGAVLGFAVIQTFPFPERCAWLTALLLLHIFTERHSLSAVIAGHPVLNWLDEWGREKKTKKDRQVA